MNLELVPVATADHALARLKRPLDRSDLEAHVQLVLSNPYDHTGADYGVVGSRLWHFVDLSRRLDFLLAGFGWCKMPRHIVAPMLADGRLAALDIQDESILPSASLLIYAAHGRDKPLGRAGAWLLGDLRERLNLSQGQKS